MFRKQPVLKVNLPGGIVSAGDLYALALAAEAAGVEQVQLGNRQQLFLKVSERESAAIGTRLNEAGLFYEDGTDQFPNLLSSYVAEGVFDGSGWLSEGLYKDILDAFTYRPRLKINLVDGTQTFVPFFTGNLNFISAPVNNYWYLYVRFPKSEIMYRWKGLVYSQDIPRISRLIEHSVYHNRDLFYAPEQNHGETLYTMVHAKETFLTQPVTEELQLPAFALPYYEGFNKSGNGYWLGIYRREETFPVSFLKEACLICMQTKIGQLYTTPWKSLIIKGIDPAGRRLWDLLLGKYRINVRHASNELNWQVENLSEESLALKRFIIRQFDREDVRTFGLSFAIKTDPRTRAFGSIVIRKKAHPGGSRVFDKYDLLYTPDFNPNAGGLVLFRDGVPKEALGVYLVSLCKYYYEQQNSDDLLHHIYRQQESLEAPADAPVVLQHQCMHCLTLYDTETGEPDQGIAPGTPFEALSYSYRCPLCDAGKEDFISIVRKSSLDGVGVRT